MGRFIDMPLSKIRDFEEDLQAAGLKAEHVEALLRNQRRLREWVAMLDQRAQSKPPATRVLVKSVFSGGRAPALLQQMHFAYLDEVAECTEEDFLGQRSCGSKTLAVIVEVLKRHGLELRTTHDEPSPLVTSSTNYTRSYYRPRIGDVRLWDLIDLSYTDDMQNGHGCGDLTLQRFQDMSHGEQAQIFTAAGLHKIESFIARNGL